ncbi:MAG: MarR family transcriptional regulator [Croceibacterium sp.]
MAVNLGPMETNLGFQIHLSWRAVRKRMLKRERRSGTSPARGAYSIPILIKLNPGISKGELAHALFLDASNVFVMIKDLESSGWVEQIPSPSDRRKIGLHLTEKGKDLADEAEVKSATLESTLSSALDPKEQLQLVRLLVKFQQNL